VRIDPVLTTPARAQQILVVDLERHRQQEVEPIIAGQSHEAGRELGVVLRRAENPEPAGVVLQRLREKGGVIPFVGFAETSMSAPSNFSNSDCAVAFSRRRPSTDTLDGTTIASASRCSAASMFQVSICSSVDFLPGF